MIITEEKTGLAQSLLKSMTKYYYYKCLMKLNGFDIMYYTEYRPDRISIEEVKKEPNRIYGRAQKRINIINARYLRKKGIMVNIDPTHPAIITLL